MLADTELSNRGNGRLELPQARMLKRTLLHKLLPTVGERAIGVVAVLELGVVQAL